MKNCAPPLLLLADALGGRLLMLAVAVLGMAVALVEATVLALSVQSVQLRC